MQSIITYIIVVLAFAYPVYKAISLFCRKRNNISACTGCASCAAKKEILELIEKKKGTPYVRK